MLTSHLDKIYAGLEECRDEVRRLVHDLRDPPVRTPLAEALRSQVAAWAAAARDTGLRFELTVSEVPAGAHPALERVAGEAVTNVVRHAGATWCRVALTTRESTLTLTVEDDGRGFDGTPPGVGLSSMRHRLAAIGGTLTIVERPGGGTVVTAVAPVSPGGS